MGLGLKIGLAAVAGALVLGAAFLLKRGGSPPTEEMIMDEVGKLTGGAYLKVTGVNSISTPAGADAVDIQYRAVAEVTEPLYEKMDATGVLRNELQLDLEAWQKARQTLAGVGRARIMALAGLKGVDDALLQTTFLTEVSPAGKKVVLEGRLKATRAGGSWQLSDAGHQSPDGTPPGQPRAKFSGRTSVVSDPVEMEKLRSLAKGQAEVPARIEQARVAYLQERRTFIEKTTVDLVQDLAPGALFAGTATSGSGPPERLYLEITAVRAGEKQIAALLRNDGGWSDARIFQGSFASNPEDGTLTVTLATQRNQAVRKAGPFLERNESWQVVFQFSGVTLAGHSGEWDYSLTRLSEANAAAKKAELDAEAGLLRAATVVGKIYRGTVRAKSGADAVECMLRFNRQESDGAVLGLTIEPLGRDALQRTFRGAIIGNRMRAEGWPLRLESRAREAVKAAADHPLAGKSEDIAINLKLVDGRLVGEGKDFTCEFGSMSDGQMAKFTADKNQRELRIMAQVAVPAVFTGQAHSPDGLQIERLRLRIRKLDQNGASVDAILESLETNGVTREFRGTLDLYGGRLVLIPNGRPRGRPGASMHFPAFVEPNAEMTMTLTVGDKLTGELKPSNWTLDF